MRFALSRNRSFDALARDFESRARRSVAKAVVDLTEDVKQRLRLHTVSAGLGLRLANTWQNKLYGTKGWSPAGFVYSKAPAIVAGQSFGGRIAGKDGWLAIPGPGAPRQVGRGLAPTPARIELMYGRRLELVLLGPRLAALAMRLRPGRGKRGGYRRPSAGAVARGDVERVVMFWLVPEVTMKMHLDPAAVAEPLVRRLPAMVAGYFEALD